MDDLVVLAVGIFLGFVYLAFACAVAAIGAVIGTADAIATFVSRLGGIVVLAVKTRGGDQRAPRAPEPAFEIYFGPPLIRDFKKAFAVSTKDLQTRAFERRKSAAARFTGPMRPLAWGIAIGAYIGSAIGMVVGSLVAVILGVVVVVVASTVWATARLLQVLEKTRRRLRGAHFDCPSCHERSPLPVYVCPGCGAKHHELLPGRWGIRRRRCQCDQVSLPVLESGGRHSLTAECPKCAHFMPGASGIVPEISVPIIGGPKAGKTAMLASVFVELDNRTQAGTSRLAVIEDSRAAFDQLVGDLRAGRAPAKTLDRDMTPALVAEVRSGASRSALLYAHDVAGERYQQTDTVRDMTQMTRARGAIVLIDPFSLPAVEAELDGRDADKVMINPSAEDPQSVVERFVQTLRESGRSDFKKLPIAVVVSKTDALDAGDGIRPRDNGKSVEHWLENHGGGNLVRFLQGEFDTIHFFAASALGRMPDPSDTSAFTPLGTLEPFLWLLAENKISLTSDTASTEETVTEKLSATKGAQSVAAWPKTPLFAPQPQSGGGYAAGLAVAALLIVGLIVGAASLSHSGSQQNADYVGSTGLGNTGSGNTGSGNTGSGNTGSGNTGSGNTGSGNTGSGNTGSGNTGSGNSDLPQMGAQLASEYAARSGTSDVPGIGSENCPAGVTVSGEHTDCSFAASVQSAYQNAGIENGSVSTTSPDDPAAGDLRMHCTVYSGNVVACIGGIANRAIVFFNSGSADTGNTGSGDTGPGQSTSETCGTGIKATTNASCTFADNVFYEYWKASGATPTLSEQIQAWDATAGQSYALSCEPADSVIDCSGPNVGGVQLDITLTTRAVSEYSASLASAYAASGKLGPNTGNTSTTTPTPAVPDAGSEAALKQYWADMSAGDYNDAYALEGPKEQAVDSEATMADDDAAINVIWVKAPVPISSDEATVRIDFFARNQAGSDQNCRNFSLTELMINDDGNWLYDGPVQTYAANLANGNPDCPS